MTHEHQEKWQEFRRCGLLWWVNRALHLLGWAVVAEMNDDGKIIAVYPERVTYRGFSREDEEKGFKAVTQYLRDNATALDTEARE